MENNTQQCHLGRDGCTKLDEFSEKFQRGGVIFNPKIYVADFGNFKQGFLIMKLIQNKTRVVLCKRLFGSGQDLIIRAQSTAIFLFIQPFSSW